MLERLEDKLASAVFTVVSTADAGPGTLRQAILDANTTANAGGPDEVHFAIPGPGAPTISPTAALPDVTDSVVIDGYTQPGAVPNSSTTAFNDTSTRRPARSRGRRPPRGRSPGPSGLPTRSGSTTSRSPSQPPRVGSPAAARPAPRRSSPRPLAAPFAISGSSSVTLLNPDGSAFGPPVSPFGTTTARAVVAEVTGDGIPDLAVGTGPRTAARVVVIDGATRRTVTTLAPFEGTFTGGTFVAAGAGGGPRVLAVSGKSLLADGAAAVANPAANFFAGDTDRQDGARVAAKDLDGDRFADLVVAVPAPAGRQVVGFRGAELAARGQAPSSRTTPGRSTRSWAGCSSAEGAGAQTGPRAPAPPFSFALRPPTPPRSTDHPAGRSRPQRLPVARAAVRGWLGENM